MDNEHMVRQIEAKISPENVRTTLMFSSLLQLTHELIKRSVIVGVKQFFGFSDLFGQEEWLLGADSRARYQENVLSLAPNREFDSSAIWLEQAGAITAAQRSRLSVIYSYRHELTHEMAGFLVDAERSIDDSILIDALQIAQDLDRFWISIEKDIGTFDELCDADIDSVLSGQAIVLQIALSAYLLRDAEAPPVA